MSYQQEWEQHQALLKEVIRLNNELQAAEVARNTAMQPNSQEGQQHLETKIEQLREEKAAAETRMSAFELQVAQENPEHARWLDEQQRPTEKHKIDKELAIDVADQVLGILPNDPSTSGLITQTAAHVLENAELMKDYTMGAIQKGVEEIKEKFFEKDAAKEWEKDIEKKEQAINEKFDKEVKETEKSLQKQSDYIEKKYDGQEKEAKINALKEMEEKVKADIENDRNNELSIQEDRKANLEKIKEATNGMNEKEKQRIIDQQRELEERLERERER